MKKIIYTMLAFVLATASTGMLTSCEDVPAPYTIPTNGTDTPGGDKTETIDPAGAGTAADPYNVAAAINYIANGGSEDTEVYVKGKVVSVQSGSFDASYGSLKYYISDDGTSNNEFLVYNGYAGPNRTKFTSEDDLKAGDEVVICGKLVNYSGTKEFTTGNYIYSLNGKTTTGGDSGDTPSTGEATGDGTLANPYNCVAANKAASALASGAESETDVYIKGKVASIKEQYSSTYGNASFYISDDGTSSNQFYVFRALYLNNEKYSSGTGIAEGDEVIICGKLTNYMGNTPETVQNKAYLYSLNSSGDTGGEDTPATSEGIAISGTTVTLTNSAATAGEESITVDFSTLGYSNAADVETVTLSDGTTISFDKNGETNGPKYYNATKGIRVYKNNKIVFTGKAAIAQIVMTCDSYNGTDYVGNTTATLNVSGNTLTYDNVFTGESGGGVQLRVKTVKIVYAK